ncbi:hypothetical protein ACEWK1_06490 [Metabacillus sp. YM-086]|uniref:hypothetical protein n=1 Tax=Metabacillus sp. YM-086 TaxID=3341729 RepID=UPI003A850FEC
MNSKILKNLAILSVLVVISLFQFDTKAQAAENTLPFDVETTGSLTEQTKSNDYTIDVTEAGRISFDLTSYVHSYAYIKFYDSNNKEIFNNYVYGSSSTPGRFTRWEDVEPGTYHLKIYNGSSNTVHTGSYKIITNFTSAGSTEVEPNNGTVEAQELAFSESVNGFLAWDDKFDFFKITVPKSGQVDFNLTSYVDTYTYISLIDSNNKEIFEHYVNGSSKNPAKFIRSEDLNKGTYYVKVYNGSSNNRHTGKYTLNTTFTSAGSNESEPNNGIVEAESIAYNKTKTGFLTWDDKVDVYKVNVTVPGKVGIDLSSYVDSTVYIEMLDYNNNSLFEKYVHGSAVTPGKYKNTLELETGTYYLKVYNGSSSTRHTGKYLLTVTPPANTHIGRVLIRSNDQYLYSPNGSKHRKLRQHEGLRIYKVLSDRYDVGGGYYVKKTNVNLFYIGHVWSKEYNLKVYKPDGSFYKYFDRNEPVRVYGYSNGRYDVGAGYFVKPSDDVQLDR